jgi:predicted AAA+ superfamily ATPase
MGSNPTGVEVDLILSKSRSLLAVEINSTDRLDEVEVRRFSRNADALKPTGKYFVSQDPIESKQDDVHCIPWDVFLKTVFQSAICTGLG